MAADPTDPDTPAVRPASAEEVQAECHPTSPSGRSWPAPSSTSLWEPLELEPLQEVEDDGG